MKLIILIILTVFVCHFVCVADAALTFATLLPSVAFQHEPIAENIVLTADSETDQGFIFLNVFSNLSDRMNEPTYTLYNPGSLQIESYQQGLLAVPFNFTTPASFCNVTLLFTGTFHLEFYDAVANRTVLEHDIVILPRKIPLALIDTVINDAQIELITLSTINHINNAMPEYLPNTTLTLNINRINSSSPTEAVRTVLNLMSLPDKDVPLIIFGPQYSVECLPSTIVAGTVPIPIMSFESGTDITNGAEYPFFMRTTTETELYAAASIADFILRMGYTRIATVIIDELPLPDAFFTRASVFGIDVAVKIVIQTGQTEMQTELEIIQNTGVKIIITSLTTATLSAPEDQHFYRQAIEMGMIGPGSGYIWITYNIPTFGDILTNNFTTFFNGIFTTVVPEVYEMPEFRAALVQEYNSILMSNKSDYLYYQQNVNYLGVDSPSNLFNNLINNFYGTCQPLNGVLTAAEALNKLIYVDKTEYNAAMLMSTLKNVNFDSPCGNIQFDNDGDLIYPSGMGNVIYIEDPMNPGTYDFDITFLDIRYVNEKVIYLPNDTIPMLLDLTGVTFDGNALNAGLWIPDFACSGGCGQGWCLGYNDCQCKRGWRQSDSIISSTDTAAPCDTPILLSDDTIQLTLPAKLFLLTRAYEEAIKTAVSLLLGFSEEQVDTVTYGPWTGSSNTVLYEFRLYDSIDRSNLILDEPLNSVFQSLVLLMDSQKNSSQSLLSYSQAKSANLILQTRPDFDKSSGFAFAVILAVLLVVVFCMACILYGFPLPLLKPSKIVSQRRRKSGFSWLLNGTSLIGIAIGIFASEFYTSQQTNWHCNFQQWIFFLSLTINLNVKIAKLYRLYCIFNNPKFKRFHLTNVRLALVYVFPSILVTVLLLMLDEIISGAAISTFETAANISSSRNRVWVCKRRSSSYIFESLLVSWYLVSALFGAILRFLCRQIQRSYLDPLYTDVFLFVLIPMTFAPLWLYFRADLTYEMTTSPVVLQTVTVAWIYSNTAAALILQYLVNFIQDIRSNMKDNGFKDNRIIGMISTKLLRSGTEGISKSNASVYHLKSQNSINLMSSNVLVPYILNDTNISPIKCSAASMGRFFRGQWHDYEIKILQNPSHQNSTVIGLFHRKPPKDWSGIIFTAASLVHLIELDSSAFLVRLFTRENDSYLLQFKNENDYALMKEHFLKMTEEAQKEGSLGSTMLPTVS